MFGVEAVGLLLFASLVILPSDFISRGAQFFDRAGAVEPSGVLAVRGVLVEGARLGVPQPVVDVAADEERYLLALLAAACDLAAV